MLKASINMGLVALCIALSIAVGLLHVSPPGDLKQPPPHNDQQPSASKQQDGQAGVAPGSSEQSGKGKQKGNWYDTFAEHTAEWLIALFTGLLVYVTYRLESRTGDLQKSTEKLWEAGEEQIAATQASAAAAGKSAKIANDSLVKLQRAFVVFKGARRGERYRDDSRAISTDVRDAQFISITVELENSGATPTRKLRAHMSFSEFGPNGFPAGFAYLDADTGEEPTTFVVGPRAAFDMAPFGISFAALERIRDKTTSGYLWGWVEYDDIFDETPRHRTEVCMRITTVVGGISDPRIQWSAHTEHNAMDEDCPRERWQTTKGGTFIEPRRPKLPRRLLLSRTTGEIKPG
jgi:hypothetical protein